jgi:hypothetical protein
MWRLPTVLSRFPHRFYVSTPTTHMSACRVIGRERLVTRVSCKRRLVACSLSHEPTFLPLHLARAALGRRFRTAVGNGNVLQVGTRWLLAGVARWYSTWSKWWCHCGAHIHTTSRCVTWEAEWDVDPRGIGVNTNVPYGGAQISNRLLLVSN